MTDLDREPEPEPDVDADADADVYDDVDVDVDAACEVIDVTTPEHDLECASDSEMWDEEDAVYDDVSARLGDIAACLVDEDTGETACTALLSIAHQLTVQNRIMIKILSKLGEE